MVEWSIEDRPSYPILKIRISAGESIVAEAGAMMAIRGDVSVETKMQGGLFKSLLRMGAGGESLFMNTFYTNTGGEVWLVPPYPGDIHYIPLNGEEYITQDTSYLAHHGDITLDVAWRGMKGLLAEGELVWLKVKGTGGVWVTAFGAVKEMEVVAGEVATIDNFHFVAMPSNVRWEVRKFGGMKSFLFGGEWLVFQVYGPAKLYLQTRVLPPFARLISKFVPSTK